LQRGDAGALQAPHRPHHVDGVAIAGVRIGDDRQRRDIGDGFEARGDLGEAEQPDVRLAEGPFDGVAGDVDGGEAGQLDQTRTEAVAGAGGDDDAGLSKSLRQPGALLGSGDDGGAPEDGLGTRIVEAVRNLVNNFVQRDRVDMQNEGKPMQVVESVEHTSLDGVIEALRRRICSGGLKPGTRLQEIALAEEFGVSRVRIRDALLALQQRGLVERQKNRSAVVARLDLKGVFDILEIRENLEGLVVRLATENRPPEHWQYLVELFDGPMARHAEDGNFEAYLAEMERFRADLTVAADNSVLDEMLTMLRDRTRNIVDRTTMLPGRIQQGLKELQRVVAAMRRGDGAEAERLRRENIRSQRAFVQRYQNFLL
jgi:DNA-binding GntR family transcriptional regulator